MSPESNRLQEIGAASRAQAVAVTKVRGECLSAAVEIVKMQYPAEMLLGQADKKVKAKAEELERWVWGGFMPVVAPPTPYSTFHEAALATRKRVEDYIGNCPDLKRATRLRECLGIWERFEADVTAAMLEREPDPRAAQFQTVEFKKVGKDV